MWGGSVGKMRKGGTKPSPNPLSHIGQRKPEGQAGTRSYGLALQPIWIPNGDYLLPFWSAGWGGTCGYLEGFLIWKFTLSSSTFRLIEAAESLSTVDWKLLTDVRLLGLAESFSVGRGRKYRERRGVKMGFIRDWRKGEKWFFNIQAQCAIPKWIQYFHVLLCRLNEIWTSVNQFLMKKYIGGSAERKSDIIVKKWESCLLRISSKLFLSCCKLD